MLEGAQFSLLLMFSRFDSLKPPHLPSYTSLPLLNLPTPIGPGPYFQVGVVCHCLFPLMNRCGTHGILPRALFHSRRNFCKVTERHRRRHRASSALPRPSFPQFLPRSGSTTLFPSHSSLASEPRKLARRHPVYTCSHAI